MQPARRIVQREPARGAVRQLKAWDCSMGRDASRLILVQRNRLGADFEESRLGKGCWQYRKEPPCAGGSQSRGMTPVQAKSEGSRTSRLNAFSAAAGCA